MSPFFIVRYLWAKYGPHYFLSALFRSPSSFLFIVAVSREYVVVCFTNALYIFILVGLVGAIGLASFRYYFFTCFLSVNPIVFLKQLKERTVWNLYSRIIKYFCFFYFFWSYFCKNFSHWFISYFHSVFFLLLLLLYIFCFLLKTKTNNHSISQNRFSLFLLLFYINQWPKK